MKEMPPLPKSMVSALGPIPVRIVPGRELKDGRFGDYDPKQRVIRVQRGLPLAVQWQVLYHEWMHVVIFDSGLHHLISEGYDEILCEVVGQARAVEIVQTGVSPYKTGRSVKMK